jgi:DNA-binding IclR family transcriptional regulator
MIRTVKSVHNVDMRDVLPGAQVVGRIGQILRCVSGAMPRGIGTTQVARATGLTRPTAHRLLSSLAAEGFLDHDSKLGRWHLGPEMYLMGSVAAERYDITELAFDHVRALADETGESAFLSARRGDETVCVLRQDGNFPIRSFVLYEGKRFPLGVATAGLAILSFLPQDFADRYLGRADLEGVYGPEHAADRIRLRIEATRALGYATNPGLVVQGSWGMGAAVFDGAGQPAWALSITGIESRFSPDRQPRLGSLLLQHAHALSEKIKR